MTNPRATVLLCQPSDFQRWIWQRVLICQNLAVILAASAANVLEMLEEIQSSGHPQPVVILMDRQTPDLEPERFCRCCQEQNTEIGVILLESTDPEVTHSQRQAAISYGALDILPPFEADTLALKVIAGIKKVLLALGGLTIHNDPLVSCLLALKQDMENSQSLSAPSLESALNPEEALETASNSFVRSEDQGESPPHLQPVPSVQKPGQNNSEKARHKRVYRGRVY